MLDVGAERVNGRGEAVGGVAEEAREREGEDGGGRESEVSFRPSLFLPSITRSNRRTRWVWVAQETRTRPRALSAQQPIAGRACSSLNSNLSRYSYYELRCQRSRGYCLVRLGEVVGLVMAAVSSPDGLTLTVVA